MNELILEAMSTMEACFAVAVCYALGSLLLYFGIPVWPMAAVIIAGIFRIVYLALFSDEYVQNREDDTKPKI